MISQDDIDRTIIKVSMMNLIADRDAGAGCGVGDIITDGMVWWEVTEVLPDGRNFKPYGLVNQGKLKEFLANQGCDPLPD